jgi:hypothetical protein
MFHPLIGARRQRRDDRKGQLVLLLLSAALMRVCQPAPVALNRSTTSRVEAQGDRYFAIGFRWTPDAPDDAHDGRGEVRRRIGIGRDAARNPGIVVSIRADQFLFHRTRAGRSRWPHASAQNGV